ncbi:DUF3289 family protein [Salmonella enterica subsp. enterica serovar Worthington]|nr:DUF3289 family protein [Salmonella enterica subsp. enterica serovar Worthington]
MQDHFSLDSNDITHWLYSHWDVFKIWFVLQHYEKEGYEFKPFIHKIIQDASRRQGRNPGSIDNDVTGFLSAANKEAA